MEHTLNPKTRPLAQAAPALQLPPRPARLNARTRWLLLFLAAIGWALWQTGLGQRDLLNPGGWPLVMRFLTASLTPELALDFLRLTLDAALTTLAYAVIGTVLSIAIGFVGGILGSSVWWQTLWPRRNGPANRQPPRRLIWLTIRTGLAAPRAIHEIIWGLLLVNVIGLDPLTAILAITIPYSAIVSKVFSEILDEAPRQPLLTLQNSGVSPPAAFLYTLIPQTLPDLLSYAFYRFECAIRAAAVLGIIGAGGLGYQILLSLQTLQYTQLWTLFYALFILNGLADFWSGLLRRRMGASECTDVIHFRGRARFYRHDPVIRRSLLLGALLVPLSLWQVQPGFSKLWSPRTGQLLGDILSQAWPPRLPTGGLPELLHQSAATLAISLLAVAIAGGLGLLLAFPAAHNFWFGDETGKRWNPRRPLKTAALTLIRGLLLVSRSIPAPIWALVMLFILFPGIWPGALALALYTLGVLGRLMSEVVENLDQRPADALRAQGAGKTQVFLYAILPRTIPRFIAYILYRWEETIRDTAVVGLVGAGGLGLLLADQLSAFNYRAITLTLLAFITLTLAVDLTSIAIRRTTR